MKSTLKRFLSLVLCMCMVMALLPNVTMTAFAATSGTVTGLADENIGLSFTGDADDAWSANGTSIIGAATSTGGTCSDTSYKSTLTITNKKSTTATLSFDYSIEQNSGKIQVDGTEVSSGASFTKELAANESVKVYIQSGSTSAATKITLTNVVLVSDVNATATFVPAENGTYTVDGKLITEEYSNTQSSMTAYQLEATPAEGYRFKGWYDVDSGKSISTDAKTALNFDSDRTITARFVSKELALFETGGQVFDDLNDAVTYAQANGQSKITLETDGSIGGSYTIPTGITLLIPFDEAKTCYTTTPAPTTSQAGAKVFRTLTMAEGSSITLENGAAISVGGQYYAAAGGSVGKMVGPYGWINMKSGSAITVQSGATLYAWGFISGSGSVTVESGGSVYEWYQILDFRGGSASSEMGNKVFPFSQYAVQNVEVPLTLHAGASETVYTAVYAIRKINPTSIPFIGDGGMFKLTSGSLTKAYDGATDRIHYTITGVAEVNSLNLKLGSMSVSSSSYVLPFTNNMTVDLTSGSKLSINQTAALLPGVQANIAQGAEMIISSGKSIYIYDRDEWVAQNFVTGGKFKAVPYTPRTHYNRTEANLIDVKVDVNGTLTANGGIYTTAGGADICSSAGTGVYNQQGTPGTEAKTYQYTQIKSNVTAHEIPITPAKLHNLDNSYTETANASAGQTIPYCTCPTCGGKWLKDFAAIIDSTDNKTTYHPTLQEAVKQFPQDSNGNTYIKMLHNTTEKPISVNNKNLRLDLNGRTVTGDISVTGAYKLYGMDSSAKVDYTTAPKGKIVGTVKGCAPTYQTPGDTYDCYVAIPGTEADNETANLSFHRFNISVTGYRFELAAPQCALFFIGKFQGDAEAKKHLTSLGITLTGDNGPQLGTYSYSIPKDKAIPKESDPGESPVVRDVDDDAFLFEAYLMRDINKENYQTKFTATARATFDNDGKQDSKPQQLSFKDAWTDPKMVITPEQKTILENFKAGLGITD